MRFPTTSLTFASRQKRLGLIALSTLILTLSLMICVSFGAVTVSLDITFGIIWQHTVGSFLNSSTAYNAANNTIIWDIRLPRLILAASVGAGLAGAGAIYQGLFRNPLADPYLIGVAQGAALGAVSALVLPLPSFFYDNGAVQLGAFVGALGSVLLVYNLARIGGQIKTTALLLAGIAVGSLGAAFTTLLTYLNNSKLASIYGWILGGFNSTGGWENILKMLPYLIFSLAIALSFGRKLNVLQMGEESAAQLGLNVSTVKLVMILTATLMAAAAVSVSGIIGFVGLVIPHSVRMLTGQDYRLLLALSALWGAIFMVLADSIARTLLAPAELPVSIITAFCGAPFFIYLLRRKRL